MRAQRTPSIRPQPDLWRRLDAAARASVPAVTTAWLLLFFTAPFGFPGQAEMQRSAAICCVFFWSLFRPSSMSPIVVFGLGLLADLLSYSPPGVTVLTWLLVQSVALRWRRGLVKLGFIIVWFSFISVACGAAVLEWAMTSLLNFRLLPPGAAVFEAALDVGLYPIATVVLTMMHQSLADPEAA